MERDAASLQAADLTRLARGGMVNFAGFVANSLFGFLLIIVVGRGLGASGAGPFFTAIALFYILSNTIELGADTGLVRMIPRYRAQARVHDIRSALRVGLLPVAAAGAVGALVLFAFAPQISRALTTGTDPEALVPYLRVLAPFLPLASALTVTTAATRGFGTMVPYALIQNFAQPGLRPILLLAVIALGLGTTAVALAWAVPIGLSVVVAGIVLWRMVFHVERRDGAAPPTAPREVAREFWRFSAPRAVSAVFATLVTWLDTLLVGALYGTREAGIYTAAARYVLLGTALLMAITLVIGPQISGLLTRGDHDRAEAVYRMATWWLMVVSWPAFFTLIAFSPLLLSVFGQEFTSGESVTVIMAVASLLVTAVGPSAMVLLMGGKSFVQLVNVVVGLAINVILNVILIPRLGMTGAAIAWAATLLSNNVLSVVEVWVFLRLHPLGSGFWLVAAAATFCFGVVGLVARGLVGTSAGAFAAFAVVATTSYAVVLWRSRRLLQLPLLLDAFRSRLRDRDVPTPREPAPAPS